MVFCRVLSGVRSVADGLWSRLGLRIIRIFVCVYDSVYIPHVAYSSLGASLEYDTNHLLPLFLALLAEKCIARINHQSFRHATAPAVIGEMVWYSTL